jgi:sulfur relay protein TusB/DsrH
MLVIIKSAPGTEEAEAGLSLARETSSVPVLLQNGVYLTRQGGLEGIRGNIYALDADMRLRGAGVAGGGVKTIGYDELVELMAEDKVVGMF